MGKTGDMIFLVENSVQFSHQVLCTACEFEGLEMELNEILVLKCRKQCILMFGS